MKAAITQDRIDRVVQLVANAHGTMTRYQLGLELKLTPGPISQVVTHCIAARLIVGSGKKGKQPLLVIPKNATTRNWFEGWADAEVLGLDGWKGECHQLESRNQHHGL